MDSEITCPKCNGCGKIKPPRNRGKRLKSLNPNERYCTRCKVFKSCSDFYLYKSKFSSYCKRCQCTKPRKPRDKEVDKRYRRRYDCICRVCGKHYKGYSNKQYSCSRSCHMTRLNNSELSKLPNELADQLRKEGYK